VDLREGRVEVKATVLDELTEMMAMVEEGRLNPGHEDWSRMKGKLAWAVAVRPEARPAAAPFIWDGVGESVGRKELRARAALLKQAVSERRWWCPLWDRRRKAVDLFTDACGYGWGAWVADPNTGW